MHIPDGLMDPAVAAIGWLELLVVLVPVLLLAKDRAQEKSLPRIAILSAGVFVAQMVNFPVGGGTTGHLIGGALFAILVGPTMAIIGMTVVILIQALMFGDGGLTALGLNALNMAVVAPVTGWGVYNLLRQPHSRADGVWNGLAIGAAAWASVFVAAAACAAELVVSYAVSGGTYGIAATISVPAMLGYHAIIGLGEGILTSGIIAYLLTVSPEIMTMRRSDARSQGGLKGLLSSTTLRAALSIVLVFALALPLYFLYASEGKDGLEKTMAEAGKEDGGAVMSSPFSYGESYFGALFAGILGFLVVALGASGILRLVNMNRPRPDE